MKTKGSIVENEKGQLIADFRFTPEYVRWGMDCSDDYEAIACDSAAQKMEKPEAGKNYRVAAKHYVGPNILRKHDYQLIFQPDTGEGWPDMSNPDVRQYHGWCGTDNDRSFHGCGVRKCLSVRTTGQRSKHVRIIFGADLKKEAQ